jgi:hypothetical protein
MIVLTQTKHRRGLLAVSVALTFLLNPLMGPILAAPPLGSGQVFLTVEGSDCHKRCQAKHPQHGGGHIYDNRSGRI